MGAATRVEREKRAMVSQTTLFLHISPNSWIVEGYWLWIILLPSKSLSSDFKHSEKTFSRVWQPPNFLSITRSFSFFTFFFHSLSSPESTVQSWITKPNPNSVKKAPAMAGIHTNTHSHCSCSSDNKEGSAVEPVDKSCMWTSKEALSWLGMILKASWVATNEIFKQI